METTKPKARPIDFTADSMRALLAGTKTQTRRLMQPQPASEPVEVGFYHPLRGDKRGEEYPAPETFGAWGDGWDVPCRYGKPGDLLWCREAWSTISLYDDCKPSELDPRGKGNIRYMADGKRSGRYRHARFMPRWASRLTLEIVEVRAERLHEISEQDAKAEGASALRWFQPKGKPEGDSINLAAVGDEWNETWEAISYRNGFASLWDSINGKKSPWSANQFVYVLTTKIHEVSPL